MLNELKAPAPAGKQASYFGRPAEYTGRAGFVLGKYAYEIKITDGVAAGALFLTYQKPRGEDRRKQSDRRI